MRNDALEMLHTAVNHFAPNGKVQEGVVAARREAERDHLSDREIALVLTRILVDGLAHGNWPA